MAVDEPQENFYLRYFTGHRGKYGNETLMFEFRPDGRMRYANDSNYKKDTIIRKEVTVSQSVLRELKRIVEDSQIMNCDDKLWPLPGNGRQEIEILIDNTHLSFTTAKIGALNEIETSKDPEGLRTFYFLIQDLKCFVISAMALHFRINPIQT